MASGNLNTVIGYVRRIVKPHSAGDATDRQLMEQFADGGGEQDFADLVRRHGPMVFGVCRRVLGDVHAAEDAFQSTFLLLAKKAGSVCWHESVAGWLHQVAYRVALKARTEVFRRKKREQRVQTMPERESLSATAGLELREFLDEELSLLPHKFRAPLVLCYLEGKTNEEAARLLGWTKGTVSGQLARGRDLLRARLTRRGLAFGAAGWTAMMPQAVEASVSTELATSTIQAATLLAAGKSVREAASASTATLVEGVMKAMFLTRLKTITLALLMVTLPTGMGVLVLRSQGKDATAVPVPEGSAPRTVRLPDGGPPVNGLRLTFSADKTETVMKEDGSDAEPVRLTLTFTNVGSQPIKLDNYDFTSSHCQIVRITGPDGKKVSPSSSGLVNRGIMPPRAGVKLPVIQPGKAWSQAETGVVVYDQKTRTYKPRRDSMVFPGKSYFRHGSFQDFRLTKAGTYRLQWRYINNDQNKAKENGTWSGTLVSNELELTVRPSVTALINDLESKDGATRVAATRELFRRGKAVLEDLKKAGAKQIAPVGTIRTRRLDLVYSLIEELPPHPPGRPRRRAGYLKDSFGIKVETGTTRDEVVAMGKKHGFVLDGQLNAKGVPSCYVKVQGNKRLEDVLKAILTQESKVITLNLNYFES